MQYIYSFFQSKLNITYGINFLRILSSVMRSYHVISADLRPHLFLALTVPRMKVRVERQRSCANFQPPLVGLRSVAVKNQLASAAGPQHWWAKFNQFRLEINRDSVGNGVRSDCGRKRLKSWRQWAVTGGSDFGHFWSDSDRNSADTDPLDSPAYFVLVPHSTTMTSDDERRRNGGGAHGRTSFGHVGFGQALDARFIYIYIYI